MSVDISDLFEVPYRHGGRTVERGLDCWGLYRLLHARAGRPIPAHLEAGDYAIDATEHALQDYVNGVASESSRWVRVTPPYAPLDALIERPAEGAVHIYTMIDDVSCASMRRGVGLYTCQVSLLDEDIEAWRLL